MNPIGRLSRDLRDLRWGQVAVELVLLVAGILIALAIDDWIGSSRLPAPGRDAQTERQYLEGIVRDLDRDLSAIPEGVRRISRETGRRRRHGLPGTAQ